MESTPIKKPSKNPLKHWVGMRKICRETLAFQTKNDYLTYELWLSGMVNQRKTKNYTKYPTKRLAFLSITGAIRKCPIAALDSEVLLKLSPL